MSRTDPDVGKLQIVVPAKLQPGAITVTGDCEDVRCWKGGTNGCGEWRAKLTGLYGSECRVELAMSTGERFEVLVAGRESCHLPGQVVVEFQDDGTAAVH